MRGGARTPHPSFHLRSHPEPDDRERKRKVVMAVSPVTSASIGGPTEVASRAAGTTVDLPDVRSPRPRVELPDPSTLVGGTVEVEFARHESGVQMVKFFDKRTGEVIDSLPSQRVLDAVEALMDIVRKKA